MMGSPVYGAWKMIPVWAQTNCFESFTFCREKWWKNREERKSAKWLEVNHHVPVSAPSLY